MIFNNGRSAVNANLFWNVGGSTPVENVQVPAQSSDAVAVTPDAGTHLAQVVAQVRWEDNHLATAWVFIEHRSTNCHVQGQLLVSYDVYV